MHRCYFLLLYVGHLPIKNQFFRNLDLCFIVQTQSSIVKWPYHGMHSSANKDTNYIYFPKLHKQYNCFIVFN